MDIVLTKEQYRQLIFERYKSLLEQESTPDPEPKSGESEEQSGGEGYPDVSTWEDVVGSKLERGPANQIKNTTWSDVVGSKLNRDAANQLKEQELIKILKNEDLLTEELLTENLFDWLTNVDNIQTVLDWAGIVPFIGDAADLVNAIIYFARALYNQKFNPYVIDGTLSLIGIIPVVGSAIAIPFKRLFKVVGGKGVNNIVKLLSKAEGKAAADFLMNIVRKNPAIEKFVMDLAEELVKGKGALNGFFNKFRNGISGYFANKGGVMKYLINNVFFKNVIGSIDKAIKGIISFLEGILEKAGKKAADKLNIPKLGEKFLSKSGRLSANALTSFKNNTIIRKVMNWTVPNINFSNKKKIFLGIQDVFSDYLSKEGKNIVDGKIIKQAAENVGIGRIKLKAGQTLEEYVLENPKLKREITNLTIVNKPDEFNKFLKTTSFTDRFNVWAKTITDPSIYMDATKLSDAFKTMVLKGGLLGGKTITTTPGQKEQNIQDYLRQKKERENLSTNAGGGITQPAAATAPAAKSYKFSANFPFVVGQRNPILSKIQKCFGLPQTGNYDEKLKQTLINNNYDVTNGLTWKIFRKLQVDCAKKLGTWQGT